jgi:hypothetical protein
MSALTIAQYSRVMIQQIIAGANYATPQTSDFYDVTDGQPHDH